MAAVSSVSDTSSSGRAEDTSSACRELLSRVNIFVTMRKYFLFLPHMMYVTVQCNVLVCSQIESKVC